MLATVLVTIQRVGKTCLLATEISAVHMFEPDTVAVVDGVIMLQKPRVQ